MRTVSLTEYRGQMVAVDASSWLHRGALGCALELEAGIKTEAFLHYPLNMIDTLLECGVRPYLVFDGAPLPMKMAYSRQGGRASSRAKAIGLLRAGKEQEARTAFGRCVGVTPWMTRKLIDELERRGLPFIVAPFEADAQLAFLVVRNP